MASLGFLLLTSREHEFERSSINRIFKIHSEESIVSGRVQSQPIINSNLASFFILADSIFIDSVSLVLREKINLTVSLRSQEDNSILPRIGQRIKCYVKLEAIQGERNPYEYSPGMRLKEKEGIVALGYVHSLYDIYITDSAQNLSIYERAGLFFSEVNSKAKALIHRSIEDSLTSGFVTAVVLGDKSGLTAETLDDFQRSGLTHILVVSGFNVGIVALLVYYILRLVGLSFRRYRIILSMIAVLFYCFVVGLEPSVVRALIALEFIFLAGLIERKPDVANLTAGAALVSILLNPNNLFDIGFQLSYGAVFSLAFIYPQLERLLNARESVINKSFGARAIQISLQAFLGSLAVTLGSLPIFLYHFHRVSIVGLGINVLGIPIAALITIFGFLLVPLALISSSIASVYGEATILMTKAIVFIAHISGSFQWSVFELPRPQTLAVVLYLAAILYVIRSRTRTGLLARILITGALTLTIFIARIPFATVLVRSSDSVSLLFFDVGQGDAMLLLSPMGKVFLIDFGGIQSNFKAISERSIMPLFKAEGLSELSGGFITHMHIDHYGGAVSMLQQISCRSLFTSGERATGHPAYQLDSISQALHIPIWRVNQGDVINVEKDLKIFVLNPNTEEVTTSLSSEGMNHNSLAVKVQYKNSSALLLGDIEAIDEERLVVRYGEFLRSDLVKVAHHGSKTSSCQLLVSASRPRYAIISVGANNKFGHPTRSVVSRWLRSGATVARTDKLGALLFRSEGSSFLPAKWRK